MSIRMVANSVLLLWTSLFCAVAVLYFLAAKNYDPKKRKWMIRMQLSAGCLMLSDAIAYLFRGYPGTVGYWVVRAANFGVFFLTLLTLLFFHGYICTSLLTEQEWKKLRRGKVVVAACGVGILLVLVSQFTGLYYTFDAANIYHRAAFYPISMIIPTICMMLDCSLLLQYQKRISNGMFLALGSYFVLPLIAASVQAVHYGWSLIDLSIGVSMVLMFLSCVSEQNAQLLHLEASRAQIAEKLEIATVLNRCVEKLSGGRDLDQATQELLEVINDYFQADRSYIFSLDAAGKFLTNTHEVVRAGVTAEKERLQHVPVETVSSWLKAFQKAEVFFMSTVEQEKGTEAYELLKSQNIDRLLSVPLRSGQKITGFLGVDNPRAHFDDPTLLSSIQFFVTNSLEQKRAQENLRRMSYTDALTGLSNRNRYMEVMDSCAQQTLHQVGGLYMDLNGLKHCNDTFGHDSGDALICSAADALNEVFPGQGFRIGGDEFVVLLHPIPEQRFQEKVAQFRAALARHGVSAAVGSIWQAETADVAAFLRAADDRMYQEKEKYTHSGATDV